MSFSSCSADLGGARLVVTSKSGSSKYFASGGQILRSVQRFGRLSEADEGNWGSWNWVEPMCTARPPIFLHRALHAGGPGPWRI